MPRAVDNDLRWRAVWLYYWDGWEKPRIAQCLRLSGKCVREIIDRFDSTGDVATWQGACATLPLTTRD